MRIDIEYKGKTVTVGYDYQPEERAETGIEAQYPGCPEAVAVEVVIFEGVDIFPFVEDDIEDIEELIFIERKKLGL